jgi:ADP-ribosylation factor protein 1
MGMMISSFLESWMSKKERRILLVGLDGGGKSTILYKMKLQEVVHTVPTIGFNVETVEYRNINFTIWDVGGQDKLRKLWRYYYRGTDALIFVVDSNDTERIHVAREELHKLMEEDEIKNACVLIWANKQDLPHSMSVAKVMDLLELGKFRNRNFFVQGCQATSGAGLYEGLDWVKTAIERQDKVSSGTMQAVE